ncbi:Rne/Rng family ribonuclease [Intestinibacter sp.]|uniref:Rne/Rng family ribonuclease n=1 Tax=Intestinibacter sp. TaxID=1965304 RepID=UPI002A762B35|nr:Rne/Rng family ribonuclease [Intestinibacter sp.]MDY2737687.1 Rne/Rng family ribonuclease [Intestinibacter sp.]MDY4575400.1 Rne/Rng family ribonuclease [Intestinibacter sp.]
MKQIIVQSLISSTQTAVMEDDKLVELLIEDNIHKKTKSNIYRGIVKNIKPGIEAAFVDIGFEKMAYLPIKNSDDIKNGTELLVQINKESVGTKAPKLTQEISLSGRYLVLIPSNDRITISNKILDEKERFRLKKLVKSFNKEKLGIIIRTEAVGCDLDKLKEDFDLLVDKYQNILKQFKLGIGPKLIYRELDLDTKYIKDNINEDIDKVVLNDKDKYIEIKSILSKIDKDYINKLILEENKDVFDLYKVSKEIEKALNKKVWLKSGGYLIIEKTEALTVIDVNTGKFTGNISREETMYKTNIEACEEIARQLKIRDIGGIIIVDFIDLYKKKSKQNLIKILQENLNKDKRKSEVLGITKLGLVEIARRREKDSIDSYYLRACERCRSDFSRKSINYILDDLEKEIMRIKEHTEYKDILVEFTPYIYGQIKNNYTEILNKIEAKYDINIEIAEAQKINQNDTKIIFK